MSNYVIPSQLTPYAPADATAVNANFTELSTLLNSTGLDDTGLATSSVITAKITDSAVTTAKIADGAVTTAKFASGAVTAIKNASQVALGSVSSGNQSILGSTLTQVTNGVSGASVTTTVTSNGRPVLVTIQADGLGSLSQMGPDNTLFSASPTSVSGVLKLYRDTTPVASWSFEITGVGDRHLSVFPTTGLVFLDTNASAASHTYSIWANTGAGANQEILVRYWKVSAIEL